MDKTEILNAIKSYYKFKKDSDFAKFLGVSSQVLYNWKIRNTYDVLLLSTRCPDINPEWILTGSGQMLKRDFVSYASSSYNQQVQEANESEFYTSRSVPLYDLDKNGGLKNVLTKKEEDTLISDYIKIPSLSDCNGASYIKGDSMLPVLKSGDVILFKEISIDSIFYGEMYLLEIEVDKEYDFIAVRYIQKSDLGKKYIKLTSANPNYESRDIEIIKIKALTLVKGSIRLF